MIAAIALIVGVSIGLLVAWLFDYLLPVFPTGRAPRVRSSATRRRSA